jgi:hypothetical protein
MPTRHVPTTPSPHVCTVPYSSALAGGELCCESAVVPPGQLHYYIGRYSTSRRDRGWRSSVISHQSSVIRRQLSVISHQSMGRQSFGQVVCCHRGIDHVSGLRR